MEMNQHSGDNGQLILSLHKNMPHIHHQISMGHIHHQITMTHIQQQLATAVSSSSS
jgi:hypothetical protein